MSNRWAPMDAYEVAQIGSVWYVLVRGGVYVPEHLPEAPFRACATASSMEEAFMIRDSLRFTRLGEGQS